MDKRLLQFEYEAIVARHVKWDVRRHTKHSNAGQAARDRKRLLEHLASLGPAAPFGLSQALEK